MRLTELLGPARYGRMIVLLASACLVSACAGISVSLTFAPDDSAQPTAYMSEAGRFTVDVPSGLRETVKTIDNPYVGPIELHFFLTTSSAGVDYGVVYGDFPNSPYEPTDFDIIYKDAVDGDVAATKGTLVSNKPVIVDGHQANEHVLTGSRGTYRFETVSVGTRLYSVSAIGSEAALATDEVTRFFESFRLIPE